MYRINENDPSSKYRQPFGAELVVDCPTCERPKGDAYGRVGEIRDSFIVTA